MSAYLVGAQLKREDAFPAVRIRFSICSDEVLSEGLTKCFVTLSCSALLPLEEALRDSAMQCFLRGYDTGRYRFMVNRIPGSEYEVQDFILFIVDNEIHILYPIITDSNVIPKIRNG